MAEPIYTTVSAASGYFVLDINDGVERRLPVIAWRVLDDLESEVPDFGPWPEPVPAFACQTEFWLRELAVELPDGRVWQTVLPPEGVVGYVTDKWHASVDEWRKAKGMASLEDA